MKLLLMSDTHNYGYAIEKLPDADVLIHAGDACIKGTEQELTKFSNWLDHALAKFPHVIYVPGNHDRVFNGPGYDEIGRAICNQRPLGWKGEGQLHLLINQEVTIDGVRFFGSPNTRPIGRHGWRYFLDYDNASAFWTNVAKRDEKPYDVLITHDPPYRVGDKVANNWHHWPFVGCKAIREYVEDRPPLLHVFGHIHEGHGIYEGRDTTLRTRDDKPVDTVFVNAAIRDEQYDVAFAPILVTLGVIDRQLAVIGTEQL